jgi:hypothetical protein
LQTSSFGCVSKNVFVFIKVCKNDKTLFKQKIEKQKLIMRDRVEKLENKIKDTTTNKINEVSFKSEIQLLMAKSSLYSFIITQIMS